MNDEGKPIPAEPVPHLERVTASRHPGVRDIARWFDYRHLAAGAPRHVSAEVAELAEWLIEQLPDSAELTAGLRKLLEAKDCFVRAAIATQSHAGKDDDL